MTDKPIAAGKSSFGLIDAEKLLEALEIVPGITFLDVACGGGDYALFFAKPIGPDGRLYAFDLWEEGIARLNREMRNRRIATIQARVADVSRHMPVDADSVDVGLMATVLHDLVADNTDDGTLKEVARVLKPGGRLAVVEFKKIDGPPGPPIGIRLSPRQTEARLRPYGFTLTATHDIGAYHYVTLFRLNN